MRFFRKSLLIALIEENLYTTYQDISVKLDTCKGQIDSIKYLNNVLTPDIHQIINEIETC